MNNLQRKSWFLGDDFAAALLFVLVHWLVSGYRYLTTNTIEALPIVWRLLDPAIMPRDYYLNMIQDHYNARLAYSKLLAWLAGSKAELEAVLLTLFLLSDLIFFAGLYRIARVMFATPALRIAAGIGFVVLETVFVHSYAPGNVHVLFGEMQANLIAAAFLVWAFAYALEGRVLLPFVLVGMGAVFHNLEGVLAYGAIVLWVGLSLWRGRRLDLLPRAALAACLTFAGLVAIIAYQLPLESTLEGDQAFVEMVRRRAAHHHMPQAWPLSQWLFLTATGILGTICLSRVGAEADDRRLLAIFSATLTAGFLAYCGLLLIVDNATLYKLQAAKALVYAYILWGLAIAGVSCRTALTWLLSGTPRQAVWRSIATLVVAISAAIVLFVLRYGGVAAAEAALSRHAIAYKKFNYRTADIYISDAERALYQWLRANTPPDALLLHPPELRYLRISTERSSVFTHHLIGLAPAMINEWLARLKQTENYCARTADEFAELVRRHEVSYIIVEQGCVVPAGRVTFENERFIVLAAGGG